MIALILALSSNTNTLLIAMLIPLLGFVSPLLIAHQINKNTKNTKILDWEREDVVAERAAKAAEKAAEQARLVIEKQHALDRKTDHVVKQVEEIHGLVNGHYTEAIRNELDATRDTLALMSELISNHKKAGVEPTLEVIAAFKGREKKIEELEQTLKKRELIDKESKVNYSSEPQEVIVVNPDPVPVIDETPEKIKNPEDKNG